MKIPIQDTWASTAVQCLAAQYSLTVLKVEDRHVSLGNLWAQMHRQSCNTTDRNSSSPL